MSLSGKLSPLAVNTLSGFYANISTIINPTTASRLGSSTGTSNYTKGSIVNTTNLLNLVDAINLAYAKIGGGLNQSTYDSLISIGSSTIPAMGNCVPNTYGYPYTGATTRYGFLRVLAEQAYIESTYIGSQTMNFCYAFNMCESFKSRTNRMIATLANSTNYLNGAYSNMNDLTTSDITGVNLATLYWGQDLIKSGRCIDLSKIATFGDPIDLLINLQKNNALTKPVSLALLSVGLTTSDIGQIFAGIVKPTTQQKRLVYAAFNIIVGIDLTDVCTLLNVQTEGLNSLADLLNPMKLFPNSYSSLTVPDYNVRVLPTNSKTYYLIYTNGATNTVLPKYFNYVDGILPRDIAIACVCFSASMQQIKHITSMNIEKFAQVVTHLETTKNLTVNGTNVPVNKDLSSTTLGNIALGSGTHGQYRSSDFFGAMSGLSYKLDEVERAMRLLNSTPLATCYAQMVTVLQTVPFVESHLVTLISQANSLIAGLASSYPKETLTVNSLWSNIGTQLTIELDARTKALPGSPSDITVTESDIFNFIDSISQYSLDTDSNQASAVLEAVSDLTTLGGQSLVALMRETRNAHRLGLAGGILDNDISDFVPISSQNHLGIPRVSGDAMVPGSLAGSKAIGLIPQNLDIFQISSAVTPSAMTPAEAIQDVIRCNCDCWDLIQ